MRATSPIRPTRRCCCTSDRHPHETARRPVRGASSFAVRPMNCGGRTIRSNTRSSLHCSDSFEAMPANTPAIPRILNRTYLLPGFFSARTTTCRSPSFTAMPAPAPSPAPAPAPSSAPTPAPASASDSSHEEIGSEIVSTASYAVLPSMNTPRSELPIAIDRPLFCRVEPIARTETYQLLARHTPSRAKTQVSHTSWGQNRVRIQVFPQNISPGIDIFCILTRSSHPKGTFFPLRLRFKEDEAGSRKPPRPRELSSAANMLRPLTNGTPPGRPGRKKTNGTPPGRPGTTKNARHSAGQAGSDKKRRVCDTAHPAPIACGPSTSSRAAARSPHFSCCRGNGGSSSSGS